MSATFATCTPEEWVIVKGIVARAHVVGYDSLDVQMDLAATHATCPLDLGKLLAFDEFNFLHDIAGIARHLDRRTGHLTGHFLPRCARPEVMA